MQGGFNSPFGKEETEMRRVYKYLVSVAGSTFAIKKADAIKAFKRTDAYRIEAINMGSFMRYSFYLKSNGAYCFVIEGTSN